MGADEQPDTTDSQRSAAEGGQEEERPAAQLPRPMSEPAVLVESARSLQEVCHRIAGCPVLALDTEANSMHAYRERTCIVQLTANRTSAIIDALAVPDLVPLRDAVARPGVQTVFHGGDYDITVLTRDHGFRFERVFDTMIAATMLGEPKVGLADLVQLHFKDRLDKRFQRIDWARRPLTAEQREYLQRDTIYLPALRDHLYERLEAAQIVEEAEIEFARLARRRGKQAAFDADGWRRIKGARRLDDRGRAVLNALFRWREDEARRRDLPPFKVLSPHTLVALARQPPQPNTRPDQLPFLGKRDRRRHGRAVMNAVRRGLSAADRGEIPPQRTTSRPSPEEARALRTVRARAERIKRWRREEAKRRDVPNLVVLPNPALEWIAETQPRRLEELGRCEDLGAKRLERYGRRLLELVK